MDFLVAFLLNLFLPQGRPQWVILHVCHFVYVRMHWRALPRTGISGLGVGARLGWVSRPNIFPGEPTVDSCTCGVGAVPSPDGNHHLCLSSAGAIAGAAAALRVPFALLSWPGWASFHTSKGFSRNLCSCSSQVIGLGLFGLCLCTPPGRLFPHTLPGSNLSAFPFWCHLKLHFQSHLVPFAHGITYVLGQIVK